MRTTSRSKVCIVRPGRSWDLTHDIYHLDLGLRTSGKIVKSCHFWEPRTQAIRRISNSCDGRIADPNSRLSVQIEISIFCTNFTMFQIYMTMHDCSYADDNTPYVSANTPQEVVKKLEMISTEWFLNDFF